MKNSQQHIDFSEAQIYLLCRVVFALIFLDLLLAGFSNVLAHQLQSPVLKFPYVDPTYWIMHLLRLPELFTSNIWMAWGLDCLLFISCLAIIVNPGKKWLIVLFMVAYFIYYIIFNTYCTHHADSQIPILVAPIPFLFSRKAFSYGWEALRYFILFSYSAAFLWKVSRLSLVNPDQGILILKMNLTPYLVYNPETLLAQVYSWFLHNPLFLRILATAGFIAEGVFIIGFFTRKYDRLLFWLSLMLPLGFWFFADVPFFEQVILSLTLLHLNRKSWFRDNLLRSTPFFLSGQTAQKA